MAPRRGAHRSTWPANAVAPGARDADQEQVEHLLDAGGTRLASLVGPPESGKTCLALIVADSLAARFADGAVFVDLSVARDHAQVASAVALAIGLRGPTDEHVAQRIFAWTHRRHLLLVLDNFEHLLPAAAFVAELLVASPHVKILTTTREALRLRDEQRYAVGPMAVPTPADESELGVLSAVASVALYCMRAGSVTGSWHLNEADAHAVAEICRRLDGLPLAIELAAAWSAVFSPRHGEPP